MRNSGVHTGSDPRLDASSNGMLLTPKDFDLVEDDDESTASSES